MSDIKIRYDHQATPVGVRGGLPFQETEWSESIPTMDEAIERARKEAHARFKPIHQFDGSYLQGIVVVQPLPNHAIRFYSFKNPHA